MSTSSDNQAGSESAQDESAQDESAQEASAQEASMQASMRDVAKVWEFDWPMMEVLIGGKSPIDLRSLNIETHEGAAEFIRNYGFDVSNPEDQKQIHACIVEAISFVERKLMPREWRRGNRPPYDVLTCSDARSLIVWASRLDEDPVRQAWACAILRVIHTIIHIHGIQRKADIKVARAQIMGRIERHISRNDEGELQLGHGTDAVPIEMVEWKHEKSRDSLILKLLHKPGNVAETVYDFLGVRIITKRKSDVMRITKLIRDLDMVSFPNINPARSRNTILELAPFKDHVETCRRRLLTQEMSVSEFHDAIENEFEFQKPSRRSHNPHSSASFQSIQLTCRQLIRYSDPSVSWLDRLDGLLKEVEGSGKSDEGRLDLARQIMEMARRGCRRQGASEISVFYPFEVQILDGEAERAIASGSASHYSYKRSQVRAARRRILTNIL